MNKIYSFLVLFSLFMHCAAQWTEIDAPNNVHYNKIDFNSQGVGLIMTNGVAMRSTDGGDTWANISDWDFAAQGRDICWVNNTVVYIGATNGYTAKSTDGGVNWTPYFPGAPYGLDAIHFQSTTTGIAAGSGAFIARTTSSASGWTEISADQGTNSVYGMDFFDAQNGIMVGSNGMIRQTTNGGTIWYIVDPGISDGLRDVCMASANVAYAVGQNGVILKSTSGGDYWSEQVSGTSEELLAVFFKDEMHGFAAGTNATFLYTNDGGANWEPEVVPGISGLKINDIDHYGNEIYIVTNSNHLLRRSDVVGVENLEAYPNFVVYPNPAQKGDFVNISSSEKNPCSISLFDFSGRLVLQDRQYLNRELKIRDLQSGLYFLQVHNSEGKLIGTKKIEIL